MNCAIRLRRSSKPKLRLGSESAIEGASADANGGRMALVDRDGSKDDILSGRRRHDVVDFSLLYGCLTVWLSDCMERSTDATDKDQRRKARVAVAEQPQAPYKLTRRS